MISENKKKKDDLTLFEYTHKIGNMIIAVPNEYDDIIYGEIIGHGYIGKSPVAYVYDYLRKEELLLLQTAYPYKESFARALSNLHPSERHILIYRSEKNFSSINKDTIIGWEETKVILEKNGFFKKLEEKK